MWVFDVSLNQIFRETSKYHQLASKCWKSLEEITPNLYIVYYMVCVAVLMCAVCLITCMSFVQRWQSLLAAKLSAESGVPASRLSVVTFDLTRPFMSGARSGDSELSLLIRIWKPGGQHKVDSCAQCWPVEFCIRLSALPWVWCACGVKKSCSHSRLNFLGLVEEERVTSLSLCGSGVHCQLAA